MPNKTLRSIIQEKFPIELRLDLEILSKQRSFSNREKQEELILTLQRYNIDDIVKLGSGTNRYAFKLDGYVIKFATDSDGKIDNLKEFKMAKRLYPHVIQCHEVTENGTILVCEYITPFDSQIELRTHSVEIIKILKDLSNVYLIGDVGIDPKNYANWGTRIGSSAPVCLDFAYVYDARSSIMSCFKCNGALMPDPDFKYLICSNGICGTSYKFDDIRARINDVDNLAEIGDLGIESYRMTEKSTLFELDESRSNYLNKTTKKKKKVKLIKSKDNDDNALSIDTFVMSQEL